MASIIAAVLKATVGLLFNKSRDLAADKLKEGDVTEQQFRNMIVREIDDIKSKLDGLARKDLLTSISIFKEGIVFLYKVLEMKCSCKKSTATEQGAVTQGSRESTSQLSSQSFESDVKVSLAMDMESLDDSGKRALADAKKRFDEARVKATEAFNNVALSTSDRILAMQYRIMSTILEKIDNPKEAIAACKLCLEELHSMPTVSKSFKVDKTGGFLSLFNKEERAQTIKSVCDVNRAVLRITEVTHGVFSRELEGIAWPTVNIGEREVNPLRDRGIFTGIIHSRVLPWSFGQEGEEEHKLKRPQSIRTNSKGQFIVADCNNIKLFDSDGKFLFSCTPRTLGLIKDVAYDQEDNLFVLTTDLPSKVAVFNKEGHRKRCFSLKEGDGISVTVNENQRVFVLFAIATENNVSFEVAVCEADGQYVYSFGPFPDGLLPTFITSASDNRLIVLGTDESKKAVIYVLDAEGLLLGIHGGRSMVPICGVMAFHLPTEHMVIPSLENGSVNIAIRTKDGKLTYVVHLETKKIHSVSGITSTTDGRIAVLCTTQAIQGNGERHVVFVL